MNNYQIRENVEIEYTDDEMFVFSFETTLVHVFNSTAALVMKQIQEGKSIEEILQVLCETFTGVEQSILMDDLEEILKIFMNLNIIKLTGYIS